MRPPGSCATLPGPVAFPSLPFSTGTHQMATQMCTVHMPSKYSGSSCCPVPRSRLLLLLPAAAPDDDCFSQTAHCSVPQTLAAGQGLDTSSASLSTCPSVLGLVTSCGRQGWATGHKDMRDQPWSTAGSGCDTGNTRLFREAPNLRRPFHQEAASDLVAASHGCAVLCSCSSTYVPPLLSGSTRLPFLPALVWAQRPSRPFSQSLHSSPHLDFCQNLYNI